MQTALGEACFAILSLLWDTENLSLLCGLEILRQHITVMYVHLPSHTKQPNQKKFTSLLFAVLLLSYLLYSALQKKSSPNSL